MTTWDMRVRANNQDKVKLGFDIVCTGNATYLEALSKQVPSFTKHGETLVITYEVIKEIKGGDA